MAWSVTDWTTKPIWQYATLVNEFASAISERRSARDGGGAFTVISAGDIIQPFFHLFKYILWTMQMEIEDLITDWLGGGNLGFVKSHAGGESLGAGWYDGRSSIPVYASLAEAFTAAGLDYTNWRRYTTHPNDGGVVAYGPIDHNDIIGPWIFEDMQKILNVLVWTGRTTVSYVSGDAYDGEGLVEGSWEAAKDTAGTFYARTGDGSTPRAQSRGMIESLPLGGFSYSAWLEHDDGFGQVEEVWNGVTRHGDWYVKAVKYFVWDDYGDDVIEDMYSLWSQDEPATDAATIVSATKLGNASIKPTDLWCAEPTGPLYPAFTYRGWQRSVSAVVLRWNVLGGFTYQ